MGRSELKHVPFWKRGFARIFLRLRRVAIRHQYDFINRLDFGEDDLIFMNYGYAFLEGDGAPPELEPDDARDRMAIHLYEYLLRQPQSELALAS